MEKINLLQKLNSFNELWNPKIIAELNGQHIKLVKLKGEFTWHHHEIEDEMFMVIKGYLTIKLPNEDISLSTGELVVIPAGIEHKPVAQEETHVLLFEPKSTLNTGDVHNNFTIENPDII